MILLNILIMHSLGSALQVFKRQQYALALPGCFSAETAEVMALLLIRPCFKKKKYKSAFAPILTSLDFFYLLHWSGSKDKAMVLYVHICYTDLRVS